MPPKSGLYRALVTNINDPLLLGRIRVSCPQLWGSAPTGWISPHLPSSIPSVGQQVIIGFEACDEDHPIWFGQPPVATYTAAQVGAVALATVTTAGDLIVGTGSGTVERLPKGSGGQVLTVGGADPSGLEWAPLPAAPSAAAGTLTSTPGRYVGATNGAPTYASPLLGDCANDPTNRCWWLYNGTAWKQTPGYDGDAAPIGGLISYTVGPGGQIDAGSTATVVFTVTVPLIGGHKYEVTLSTPIATHITAAATSGTDQIYCQDSQSLIMPGAGAGPYLRSVSMIVAPLNESLSGSSSCIISPASNMSDTFTVSANAGNAGNLRCYANSTSLIVKRVA